MKNKTFTTLLELGGEGGSTKINKMLIGDKYKYWYETNESAMADLLSEEDLEGISLSSKSEIVDTFEEAFEMAKNKYKVFKLCLDEVSYEVKEHVAQEYNSYLQSDRRSDYIGHRWKRVFENKGSDLNRK